MTVKKIIALIGKTFEIIRKKQIQSFLTKIKPLNTKYTPTNVYKNKRFPCIL